MESFRSHLLYSVRAWWTTIPIPWEENIRCFSQIFDNLLNVEANAYIILALYFPAVDSILTSSVGSSSTMESFTMYGFTDWQTENQLG